MNDKLNAAAEIEEHARLLGWHAHRRGGADGFPDVILVRPSLTPHTPAHLLFVALGDDDRRPIVDARRAEWGERLISAGARWYPVAPSTLPTFLAMLRDLACAA